MNFIQHVKIIKYFKQVNYLSLVNKLNGRVLFMTQI